MRHDTSGEDALLLDHGREILILVDLATLEIRAANGAARRLLGNAGDALIGRPVTDIVSALTDIFYWEDVRRGVIANVRDVETQYLRADGKLLNVVRSIIRPDSHPDTLVICAVPADRLRRSENELADTVARLRAALEGSADGLLLLDRNGTIANMNRQFARIWQIPDESILANDDSAIFEFLISRLKDRETYQRRLKEILPDNDSETFDLLSLDDGRYLECKSRPAKLGHQVIGRVFSFADVSEHKARESQLKLAASVFSHAHEGILITDAVGDIVDVNATFCRITGYAREEVLGRNPRFLQSGRHNKDFYRTMWEELIARGYWEGEIWNRRKSGELYIERLSITAVEGEIDASPHYVAVMSDITRMKEHERQLERMAHYDALTGMPNRALLADRMKQAIAQARRHHSSLALIYLDIDGFKEVNDVHGRDTGDQLLITIAYRLRGVLRENDTLARLGGDEFAAVITDLDGWGECELILSRLLETTAMPIEIHQQTFQLSTSIGITLFPQDDADPDTLLRHADQAMYQAKQNGRNRYYLFDHEKERKIESRYRDLDRIAQGIEQNEFVLYYQPKVNLRTGAVFGAEALLRWRHPERGLILPGDFLPSIEENDLIVRLGDWVLDTVLEQMAVWSRRGFVITASVNVSALQLQRADFLPKLEKRLVATPEVNPGCLELEVVETVALKGIAQISRLMEDCQSMGVGFSLDDFGTGYSSLTYLRRLPANVLKIDQSFVRDMLWDTGDLAIVQGIIGLAAAFGRTVIAEGVETEEHGKLLLRLECDLAQGYGIARPMPADELPAWVAGWRPPSTWSGAPDPKPV
jgi:diguanylate cyclase (GGDEF)-like protein/PAS domain S-box-containing protein